MRCKNCGCQNDDNNYICQNCGSPLYDEDFETDAITENLTGKTFPSNYNSPRYDEKVGTGTISDELTGNIADNDVTSKEALNGAAQSEADGKDKQTEKKSIIVIAILAVILVAIITSVIVVAQTKSRNENTTDTNITDSTNDDETENATISSTSTTNSTTQSTTASTSKPTKPSTSRKATVQIKVISNGGGIVNGGGTYNEGDNVTITATPDASYEFDGWYSSGGNKISAAQSYSFTALSPGTYIAKFRAVEENVTEDNGEPTDEEPEFVEDAEYLNGGMD